ncbi:MAG: hypothetical protein K8S18_21775 [Desulfobacula sp.]|nr:hypothetical protein [Desulfobacula sp.]
MVLSELNQNLIIDALQDYKKCFESKYNIQEIRDINCALEALSKNIIEPDSFPVTYISKDDIIQAFPNNSEVKTIVNNLDDADMKHLASKLADDYCEQLFWESLQTIFKSNYL